MEPAAADYSQLRGMGCRYLDDWRYVQVALTWKKYPAGLLVAQHIRRVQP